MSPARLDFDAIPEAPLAERPSALCAPCRAARSGGRSGRLLRATAGGLLLGLCSAASLVGCKADPGVDEISLEEENGEDADEEDDSAGAPACEEDSDCDDGLSCNQGRGICVECIVDSDCGEKEQCSSGSCEARARCASSEDCKAGVCDTARELCVDEDGEPITVTVPEVPVGSPEPGELVAEPAVPGAEPTDEPSAEPSSEPSNPEPNAEPAPSGPEPADTPEPVDGPEPVEPSMGPMPAPVLTGTPAVLILAEHGSSMFMPSLATDAGDGCSTGSSPAYGAYLDRWEAMRAMIANLEDLSGDIDFSILTFRGEQEGSCPLIEDEVSAAEGFAELLAALPPSEAACPTIKGESPLGATITEGASLLEASAPNSPKYLLVFTRGTPDTCLVPDPQCGQDKAIAAAQDAYARGITTLVVSLHAETEVVFSEYLAQAGQGRTVAPYPEDVGEESCVIQEYTLSVGGPSSYDAWRDYAEASYGPTGFVHEDTLGYTGLQADDLHAALSLVASGEF